MLHWLKKTLFLVSFFFFFFFFFDNNRNYVKTTTFLTRFRMGIWLLTDGGPGRAERFPSLKSVTDIYPTMMKLGTVIPYLKKIKKNINHVTHTPFFLLEISKFCYMKKYRYRLHFDT